MQETIAEPSLIAQVLAPAFAPIISSKGPFHEWMSSVAILYPADVNSVLRKAYI